MKADRGNDEIKEAREAERIKMDAPKALLCDV